MCRDFPRSGAIRGSDDRDPWPAPGTRVPSIDIGARPVTPEPPALDDSVLPLPPPGRGAAARWHTFGTRTQLAVLALPRSRAPDDVRTMGFRSRPASLPRLRPRSRPRHAPRIDFNVRSEYRHYNRRKTSQSTGYHWARLSTCVFTIMSLWSLNGDESLPRRTPHSPLDAAITGSPQFSSPYRRSDPIPSRSNVIGSTAPPSLSRHRCPRSSSLACCAVPSDRVRRYRNGSWNDGRILQCL